MSPLDYVIPFACAIILGLGIGIGGMLNPVAALRMFSAPYKGLQGTTAVENVDFTLMVVFMSALVTNLILYRLTLLLFKKPIFGNRVNIKLF